MELGESAHLAIQGKNKGHGKQKGKGKIPPQDDIKKKSKCFFYRKKGNMRRIVLDLRPGSRRKVIQPLMFVMNLIWLM